MFNRLVHRLAIVIGSIISCGCVLKPAPSDYLEYATKTDLQFPLAGEAFIGTGGRNVEQNPDHIMMVDQRFAIDVVALPPGAPPPKTTDLVGRILSGDFVLQQGGSFYENESHYCFGRPVLAPGSGVIADARDGVVDNIPGTKTVENAPGNYVVIDHLNGEFSMLAHFKQGSVAVEVGDQVKAGDHIGLCGNSGHSNLPHLHYHLQNTAQWFKGEGLPAQFRGYYANGEWVEKGEPQQGQIITQPE